MKRILIALAVVLMLGACTITEEGLSVHTVQPSIKDGYKYEIIIDAGLLDGIYTNQEFQPGDRIYISNEPFDD